MILSLINDFDSSLADKLKSAILSIDQYSLVDIQYTKDDLSVGWHSVVIYILPDNQDLTAPVLYYRDSAKDIVSFISLQDCLNDLSCAGVVAYKKDNIIPDKVWDIHSDAEVLPYLVIGVEFPKGYSNIREFAEKLLECEELNTEIPGLFIQRPDGNWWVNRDRDKGSTLKLNDINNIRGINIYVNDEGFMVANATVDLRVDGQMVRLLFDEAGEMCIGWVFRDGYWYKIDPINPPYSCLNTIVYIDGETYFTDKLGRLMVSEEDQTKFYIDDNDRMTLHKRIGE